MRQALDGDRRRARLARRSATLLTRGAAGGDRRARGVERRGPSRRRTRRGRDHRQRRRRASTSARRSTATSSPTGGRHVTPYAIAVGIVGMVSSEVSISLGLRGISHVLSTGCTSSTDALGYAARLIRSGEADVLLSGGADGCVTPGMIFGFSRMRAVSTRYNDRPAEASRGRSTAAATASCWAKARGCTWSRRRSARGPAARTIYATVEGYHSTCDAYHRVQMDPDGAEIVAAMRGAVERSHRALDEIGYVNYHGTSTQLNDAIESTVHASGVRRTGRACAGVVDQVDDRPSAGRQRRGRHRRDRAGSVARVPAADRQPGHTPIRRATWTICRARAGRRALRRRCVIAWGSGRRTARLCWVRFDRYGLRVTGYALSAELRVVSYE